jgi:hypothetical protein
LSKTGGKLFLNATNMSNDARLTVELLDEQFRPLPGYAKEDFTPIKDDSGLKLPLAWGKNKTIKTDDKPVRVRVNWEGRDAELPKLWAVYVE